MEGCRAMMDSGYTARRRRGDAQTSGERLKVHLWKVSGDGQTDGCLNCQKKKGEERRKNLPASFPSATEREKLSVRSLRV